MHALPQRQACLPGPVWLHPLLLRPSLIVDRNAQGADRGDCLPRGPGHASGREGPEAQAGGGDRIARVQPHHHQVSSNCDAAGSARPVAKSVGWARKSARRQHVGVSRRVFKGEGKRVAFVCAKCACAAARGYVGHDCKPLNDGSMWPWVRGARGSEHGFAQLPGSNAAHHLTSHTFLITPRRWPPRWMQGLCGCYDPGRAVEGQGGHC